MIIRQATNSDSPQLVELNLEWQYSDSNEDQKKSGFLLNSIFSQADFEKIIKAQEIIVAEQGSKIAGYYLVDNHSDTDQLRNNKSAIERFTELGIIPKELRVALRAQVVIHKQFHNIGLSRQMLAGLKEHLKNKFDIIFSTVYRTNPKIDAHKKVGWQSIYSDEKWFYIIYDLRKGRSGAIA